MVHYNNMINIIAIHKVCEPLRILSSELHQRYNLIALTNRLVDPKTACLSQLLEYFMCRELFGFFPLIHMRVDLFVHNLHMHINDYKTMYEVMLFFFSPLKHTILII